ATLAGIRRVLPVIVTALALLAVAAPASARGFKYGVNAGDVTSSSAILWTRSDKAGRVTLQVSRDRRFRGGLKRYRLRTRRSHDNTVQRKASRLKPGKRYYYRFVQGRRRSARGTFVTAPKPSSNASVRFAWSGDTDFTRQPGKAAPYWNNGGVFQRMARERNAFNIHLGDTIYSDTEVPFPGGQPAPALSVKQKWAKYRLNIRNRYLRALRQSGGLYSHWDDHEFINDFARGENSFRPSRSASSIGINGQTLYKRGVRAFRDYTPVGYSSSRGIYRRFRWGKNAELFFLDERSFRDPKASSGGTCNNPATGKPDFAPAAPQRIRNVFAFIEPSLAQPVPPACIARLRDPSRTFLGSAQYARFTNAIRASKARWKIIVNEMPIQQSYVLPYDNWEGYEGERQKLLSFLQANVKNTIFLTTDVHATLVNDARFATFPEEGGTRNSGIFDFTVGPTATENYSQEIDEKTGKPGSGNLARDAFFKAPPPNGPGMRCAVTDKFSYGEVKATRSTLTVTAKGIDGKPLADCAPLTLTLK
ncbi:MAG TPA: alkaline phosphatase D family protein, partial [Vicinamibacteria bacterium]